MIAIVLSGGGSRGSMQVGALRALLERGVQPALVVGTSVGGINAAALAADPTLTNIDRMERLWRQTRRSDIYPGSRVQIAWRVATGKGSLYSNEGLKRHLQRHVTYAAETFAELKLACYIVATNLDSGMMRVLGERPDDRVLDALMATTALPPLHPPYALDDGEYVDGATTALLPIEVAIKHGAREVYALHIVDGPAPPVARRTMLHIGGKAIGALVQKQWQDTVARVERDRVRLHHIQLVPPEPCAMWDYSKTDMLLKAGYEQTMAYLSQLPPQPQPWHTRAWERAAAWLKTPRSTRPETRVGWR